MNKYIGLLLFIFIWVGSTATCAWAQQQDIPGVTDITSVTTVSPLNPAEFARFLGKGCQDSTYFVRQVENIAGTVHYRGDLKAYVISSANPMAVHSPDTIVCGLVVRSWVGIVCDVPTIADWIGKTVTFSGRYYQAHGVSARDVAEHVFYLHVTSLTTG